MRGEQLKVLVVDDEPTNVQLLIGALKMHYRVLRAGNGYEAITLIKQEVPDLILLDVMMPDLSGFEVARLIKADEALSSIPIIFLTALDSFEAMAEGLETGAIDYLSKPVDLNLLKLRVHNHLELKQRTDLIREQRDELQRVNDALEEALARIKRLEGTFAICMHCKSIRSDQETWQKIEEYLLEHTDALFSHGICPTCLSRHYPSFA
ncbi:hypothetical protein GMLC_31160 [Geomonas limicola]|uniref:Response regulatory domain-containing protein n=1 Tax=Geomonas limicola TaxID=2740186 RepID=A0A6V8NCK8_9BACT|nr:response regulator [Geomonas limicola]GFO69537.1 hypothetical protein GMLC_31160 [Geomonas limicola]